VFDITTGLEKTSQPPQATASANGTSDGSYGGTYMGLDVSALSKAASQKRFFSDQT
jgi:hypothetical protein